MASVIELPAETGRRGEFVRQQSAFRRLVAADGSSGLPAQADRYHLYVSLACPWAHRAVIVRMLKGLEDVVSMSVVDPIRDERGWAFRDVPGAQPDPLNGFGFLGEAYETTDPRFSGRVTVPVLWDRSSEEIVTNESADVIRILNSEFDEFTDSSLDLYPEELRDEIDAVNARVYETVNNGVYRCGFATSQEAYEEAWQALFETMDWLEQRLATRRYLAGERVTLADWRLFTTLVRFDAVYYAHFKVNRQRLVDFANLWAYARELFQWPGVAETVNFNHIKRHYFQTHDSLNPTRIVPVGPRVDWSEPHGRERVG